MCGDSVVLTCPEGDVGGGVVSDGVELDRAQIAVRRLPAWRGCISAYDYLNTVSTVTENVLRRFADAARGESPSDPAEAPVGAGAGR